MMDLEARLATWARPMERTSDTRGTPHSSWVRMPPETLLAYAGEMWHSRALFSIDPPPDFW